MKLAPILACLCLLPPLAWCSEIVGKVVGVHDGDSLTVLVDGASQLKVRLEGIDAPELKQAFGNVSKQELSQREGLAATRALEKVAEGGV